MFSPHDAAQHAIGRARGLLETADDVADEQVAADMRRSSVVFAVAALDTYMHRLILDRVYRNRSLPGGLATLGIPFESLLKLADGEILARKRGRNRRPRVTVKRVLRERLSTMTFQRHEDVAKALGMAGRAGHWSDIATAMGPSWTAASIKVRLNSIVNVRNRIVHEGGYRRLDRPQKASLSTLSYSEAEAAIGFIADLLDAIDSVV